METQVPSSVSSTVAVPPANSGVFWLEAIKHQGKAAYNEDPAEYQVFRNVKDFGAKGDGETDDTEAINDAISSGNRCGGGGCNSSTVTPALVYFPQGTYLVSKAIIAYYYTQLIGDPKNPPTLLAAASFTDMAVIDADPYIQGGNGAQWYQNQNNFFRSVRNFIIDVRRIPAMAYGTGIHWQVAQATSLMNITFFMSDASNTAHQGIWMENGSGGFMGDLTFHGGKFGMWVGSQQFTVRNIVINNAQTAVLGVWAWGWTFQGVSITNCQVGFDLLGGVGAEAIIDATVSDTPIFLRTATASNGKLVGSLVLNNIKLNNVSTAVGVNDANGTVVMSGGNHVTIDSWVQGNVYAGSDPKGNFTQGSVAAPPKPASLLNAAGHIFGKMHPQYVDHHVTDFVSVRDHGATGDGKTDDTYAINEVLRKVKGRKFKLKFERANPFHQHAHSKIIFFDAGTYIVTSTITIPAGARIVGEAWSVISGSGPAFQDQNNPQVVVRVGEPGSRGVVEITDMIFSTVGPAPGAIVVEWNVKETEQGSAGAWDTHIRLGGAAGTNLEIEQCLPGPGLDDSKCMAAFMALHLTRDSTAYLEGMWVWLADHALDEDGVSQLTIFCGRGILSESQGPVWMIGTAEHHALYQYSLVNAKEHWLGLIQTETPYFQPLLSSPLPYPFTSVAKYSDPVFPPGINMAWGLLVQSSSDILIFGAGLYSFYSSYSQACLDTRNCQNQILNIHNSSVSIYSLATVASAFQISVDGKGIVDQAENNKGFASTVTVWRSQ
ncbi:glycoside hydrolase family 55 protein [Mycena alexandri]|uniref:Glycoside hydrolase family 55 protein n=1 Tax=Mycena alexandri TaxID=1745969 RepID=A0AAD6XFC1_9AGAR|nr:glycoside hydrolase family 55 protein [Mycena alexandri]